MSRHYFLTSALIVLLLISGLPESAFPQGRPYAKYGSSGETIGIFKLAKDPSSCGTWRVITGTIMVVRSQKRNQEVDYRLTVRSVSRLWSFAFSLNVDELPRPDIVNLVTANRRVKLRACEATGPLLVEEITRT